METSFSIHNLTRHHAVATGTHLQLLLPSCLEVFSSIYSLRTTVPWWVGPTCGCCYPAYLEPSPFVTLGCIMPWWLGPTYHDFKPVVDLDFILKIIVVLPEIHCVCLYIYWHFHARTECLGSASDKNLKSLLLLYILLVTTLGAFGFSCRPWLTFSVIELMTTLCHNWRSF
jgi:hypothetical protein